MGRLVRVDDDAERLVGLFRDIYSNWRVTPEQWYWKYGPPWSENVYSLVATHGDRFIGHVGAIPLRGVLQGKECPFFQIVDILAHPEVRGTYNWLEVQAMVREYILAKHPDAVLYGSTDRKTMMFYEWLGSAARVDEPQVVTLPGGGKHQHEVTQHLQVHEWDWDHPAIDPLWETLKHTWSTGLIRDQLYLSWRYDSRPGWPYRLLGVDLDGEPIGWIVALVKDGPESKAEPVWIIDALLPREQFLGGFRIAAESMGERGIQAWLPPALAADFPETAPSRCPVTTWKGSPNLHILKKHLFYTCGDIDLF